MALELTTKYADLIDERFVLDALSTPGVNQNYSWEGAKTIKVTSVPTVALTDYTRDGMSRFGTATELSNEIQEMTLTQDKAFAFTLDKMNEDETKLQAARSLARQIREVVVPHVDTYRFKIMGTKAGKQAEGTIDEKEIYKAVLEGTEFLDDNEIPSNRVIFATPEVHKFLKLSDQYVKQSDLGMQRVSIMGQVGELDGMPVVKVPKKRLGDYGFIIAHAAATVAPIKLADYRLHQDPPGISGTLAEGRVYFDAFVLDQKKNAIYAFKGKPASGGGEEAPAKAAAKTTAK